MYHMCPNKGPCLYFFQEVFDLASIQARFYLNELIPSHVSYIKSLKRHGCCRGSTCAEKARVLRSRQARNLVSSSNSHLSRMQRLLSHLHYIHSIPSGRISYAVCFSSDLDIATAAGTKYRVCTVFNSYLKRASQMLQSASVWVPDPASIRTWLLFKPGVLLKIRCSDPRPLFEPGLYTDIYGMYCMWVMANTVYIG